MEGNNNKLTILVLVLLILAFFAYMFFFKGEDVSSDGLTVESSSGITEKISILLTQLEAVKLKDGIFIDPSFVSLSDNGLEVIPFPAGRTNPFAPIGL